MRNDQARNAFEEWQRLVARSLGGATTEALRGASEDGIAFELLYTRLHVSGEEGVPGRAPLLRGASATGNLPTAGWEIRQLHGLPEPAATADTVREDLACGVRGIWLRLDLSGADGTPRGTVIDGIDDLLAVLAPVDPARHTVAFDASPWPRRLAALVLACRQRALPPLSRLSLGLDPVGAVASGELADPDEALAETAGLLPLLLRELPDARLLVASGLPWYEAGATAAQELACTVATAIACLRLAERHALDPAAVARRLEFRLAVDPDLFGSLTKCRVLRRLWANVGKGAAIPARPFLHAVTGRRTLSRVDPWTNLLRLSTAGMAAVLGGADAITTLPFDDPLGPPDGLARRLARNMQHILALESCLHQPIDPVGGSFFAQRSADDLAAKAWALVQRIEAAGGIGQALASGLVQDMIDAAHQERQHAIATRREILVGVSAFVDLDAAPREPAPLPARTTRSAAGRMVDDGSIGLEAMVRALLAGAGFAPCVPPAPLLRTLPMRRLAEPFEQLRARGDAWKRMHGDFPQMLLACFGPPAAFVPHANFAKNLFEPGGIRTRELPVATVEDAVAAVRATGVPLVAICGTPVADEAQLVAALRAAGVRWAGRIGDGGDVGYDARPAEGVDAVALLNSLWERLEEAKA